MSNLLTIIDQWKSGVGEVQFMLAIGLFFIINFIGSRTYSIGYVPISLLTKDDSKLAFNFALRVVTPVIYLIITSSILYYLTLDKFVAGFYFVSIYYVLFRYLINAIEGRLGLLNWGRQIVYSLSTLMLSYLFYDKFIRSKQNLLPDFSNLSNELWIIIILFVYKIVNDLEVSVVGSEERKSNYIFKNYLAFKSKYGKIIDERIDNDVLKAIVYSIIIYENFNSSKIIRIVENISFHISKKPHSLGVMQMTTSRFISDEESVIQGIRKVKEDYNNCLIYRQTNPWSEYASDEPAYKTEIIRREIISKYNTGSEYLDEVDGITDKILSKFYPNSKDVLDPVS